MDGVKPQWEDEANKLGGRLALRVQKGYANKLWEDLLLAMIGEQFQDAEMINGIIIQVKQVGDQIAIWLRTGKESVVDRIKQDLVRLLSLPDNIRLDFDLFFKDDSAKAARPQAQSTQQPRP